MGVLGIGEKGLVGGVSRVYAARFTKVCMSDIYVRHSMRPVFCGKRPGRMYATPTGGVGKVRAKSATAPMGVKPD